MRSRADVLQALSDGFAQMSVSADTAQIERLALWLRMLARWNRVYNLTAIPAARQVEQLVLPSAAMTEYLRPGSVADVGSGSGVPGVVMAILAPEHDYTLIDSNGKKTRFLKQCTMDIGLDNVSVIRERAEHFDESSFDTIVSRGLTTLFKFFNLTRHLAHAQTRWLALKSGDAAEELEQLPQDEVQWRLHQIKVADKREFSLVAMQSAKRQDEKHSERQDE